ncbi:MAG: alpha-ketoglutarate-dependent dioxygenase AlkB [Flavobacteriaceae bacterium]|nr:alpha-ketoglutarate-dependent dioxygenase AlkB [Flavobacteriaceae bacterium]
MSYSVEHINLPKAELIYVKDFFSEKESKVYFEYLKQQINWQHDQIKVFGKVYDQPRLTALYAENKKAYSYSNIVMHPHQFTNELLKIKNKIETFSNEKFTTCLLNYYRNGQDSNGWHADDEKELGVNPVIASMSFGAKRKFKMRKKDNHQEKFDIELSAGSLLIMKGETQHFWQHQIPKTAKKIDPRINLTFRKIE